MPSKQRKSSDFDMHYYLWPGSPLKQKKRGKNAYLLTVKYKSAAIKVYKTVQISVIIVEMTALKSYLTD